MGIFKKKKKNDEDESDVEIEEKPIKKISKSTEPKKKKTPKPWGKKERYYVLVVFIVTVMMSGILSLRSRNWKLPGIPRISPSSINLSIPRLSLGEQKIVLGRNGETKDSSEAIKEYFRKETNKLSGLYGLYVIDLKTGFSFGVNETQKFEPASLNKLPVIFVAHQMDYEGKIDLDDTYTLKDEDKINGSGSLSKKKEGTKYTYRELLTLMGKESENTAYGVIKKLVGQENIEVLLRDFGMDSTSQIENFTTPKDTGVFFEKLMSTGLIPNESKNEIISSLTNTIYESHIPLYISEQVSHKYGREVHVVNDAGIVFDANPYVLVILSSGVVDSEADRMIPEIASRINQMMK